MRILIADDHAVVREGLSALFQKQDNLEVVAEAADGEQAITLAQQHSPDIIIMDVAMPKLNGVEAIRRISKENPDIKMIVLSMHSDNSLIAEALKAGCRAYLLKSSMFEEILTALDAVYQGQSYLSTEITGIVMDNYLEPQASARHSNLDVLTSREKQILQLIAEGYTVKETAFHLNISPKTVDTTRRNIMQKLHLDGVAQLTKFAIREGLTSLDF